MFHYLVKEDEFLPVNEIDTDGIDALDSEIRRSILEKAAGKKVSINDIMQELEIGQQAAYYHVHKLADAGLLEASSGRPKYFQSGRSAYYFRPDFVEPEENPLILENVPDILQGFVENRELKARIVVGAPYPHGQHDRRHKNAYKAGEISCILGNYGRRRGQMIHTDTEVEKNEALRENPLISVAGPLVNTLSEELNGKMNARFTSSYDKIRTAKNTYSGDETGFVARTEVDGKPRMVVAGLYGIGTSAAIEALSRRPSELGEKGAVVRGFGTKQSIEEVEILEKL